MYEEEELSLIERARQGDRQAFDKLFTLHYARVVKLCSRIVENYDDAHDCAQDTFIKAWKNIGKFSGNSAFYTWLYRIAVNTCRDLLSERNKHGNNVSMEELMSASHFPDDGTYSSNPYDSAVLQSLVNAETPLSIMEMEELQKAITKGFWELSEDQRQTLYLAEISGHSYEDVGGIVGMAANAIRVRLFRARRQLQNFINRTYGRVAIRRNNAAPVGRDAK